MKPLPAVARLAAIALPAAFAVGHAQAAVFDIDLSPGPGQALNLGANPYTQDHAVALDGLNETAMLSPTGSGDEVGAGISYDDVTNQLTFDFAYGSAFAFTDLLGPLTAMHVHGPGLVNFPAANFGAGVQFNLAGFHTPSGPLSGRITGVQILSAAQEQMLIDNLLYVNIHSQVHQGGEIRAQLILVPEPSSLALLALAGVATFRRRRRA